MNNKQKFIELIETSVQLPEYNGEAILIWIDLNDIDLFVTLIGAEYLSEGGIEVTLLDGYICFDCKDIINHMDIEESEINIARD